ncbi:Mycinamicin IV hydroxylase/epoxidase [Mycobacterium simulans]|uniref:Mycinamicin IV hydroxylase/epoxidase n=1 Tax=Mycobacterium simulans TaxID=627089 RepID=A0A7Z7N7P0_9MYCO|nr:cytochrome P450 [Mycobacterium simulans]SOJ52753.1 Mycinamicin IV hydroxylase/epoxidase [Mycobacterium simulans]
MTFPFRAYRALEMEPEYGRLRSMPGLLRISVPYGEDAWLATRYEDVKTVLGDPRFSRAAAANRDEPRLTPFPIRTSILGVDPPEQARLRQLIARTFTMRNAERMRSYARETAHRLIDDMSYRGAPTDLLKDYAVPFAASVVSKLLGVPAGDHERFMQWVDAFSSMTAMTPDAVLSQMESMYDYVTGLVSGGDQLGEGALIAHLIQAQDAGRLTKKELVELVAVLIIAGSDSVSAELSNACYLLLTEPDRANQLRSRPELIGSAVEELLRYIPLDAHVTFARYAVEDLILGGTLIRAGEAVLASIPSANRDPGVFSDPDELEFTRAHNPHLGLGHGLHRCVGSAMASMALQEGILALLQRLPDLTTAVPEHELQWKREMQVRNLASFPVTWSVRAGTEPAVAPQ